MDIEINKQVAVAEVSTLVAKIKQINPGITGINFSEDLISQMSLVDILDLRERLSRTLRAIGGVTPK